jgi:type IV pilus assembly protein PilB
MEEKVMLEINPEEDLDIYEPKGCPMCNNTGYIGRTGVYEIMVITSEIKHIISNQGSTAEVHDMALKEGMVSLRESATEYVLKGITSISELNKIIYEE